MVTNFTSCISWECEIILISRNRRWFTHKGIWESESYFLPILSCWPKHSTFTFMPFLVTMEILRINWIQTLIILFIPIKIFEKYFVVMHLCMMHFNTVYILNTTRPFCLSSQYFFPVYSFICTFYYLHFFLHFYVHLRSFSFFPKPSLLLFNVDQVVKNCVNFFFLDWVSDLPSDLKNILHRYRIQDWQLFSVI